MEFIIPFLLGMFIGALVEVTINFLIELINSNPLKIHHRFHFMGKVSLASFPIWGLLGLIVSQNTQYITLFFASAFVGTILEHLLGKSIHAAFGFKLWSYSHGAVSPYTSIYSPLYWGGAGIIFLFLIRLLGL